jgi:hypothetical protein
MPIYETNPALDERIGDYALTEICDAARKIGGP